MEVLATFPQSRWSPLDDLLLKSSVEAGASLQSLAKGAVQFSRKFTFAEIRDRWYSLLYDPLVSLEASACMADSMLSASPFATKFTNFAHSRSTNFASLESKSQSISNSYYAMRKRIFNDTITSLVSNFLAQPEDSNYLETTQLCTASHHFGFRDSNFDPSQSDFPQDMTNRSVSTNGLTSNAIYTGVENPVEASFPIHHKNIPQKGPQILLDMSWNGGVGELVESKELAVDSLIGLGDNTLKEVPLSTSDQISNEPANLRSGLERYHVLDSSDSECGMSFNTWQVPPHREIPRWRTDNCIQEKPHISYNNFIDSIASRDAYIAQLSNRPLNFAEEEEICLMDVDIGDEFEHSDYEVVSSFILDSPNEVSSDQILELPKAQASMASNASVKNISVSFDAEVDSNLGSCSSDGRLVNKSGVQMPSSVLARDHRFPELINGVICCTLNTEDPEIPSNDDVVLPFDVPLSTDRWSIQEVNKPIEDLGHSHRAIEGCTKRMQLEEKNLGESNSYNNLDNTSTNCENPKEEATSIGLVKNSSNEKRSHDLYGFRNDADTNAPGMPIQDHQMLRAEEGSSPTLDQEEQLLESDDDVPYYSDVEAMILDMDLDHDDRRWYYGEEVLKYGHENTKRAIIRLEQVARSSMERDISSQGAFAVLYGRYSRHYVKKTEVLLGRATEDIVVDLDLSKERGATKISRRQAIIKMDKVGSFYLKNLGRDRIFVNDKEVHPGRSQILLSSCLIEIRGMPYIFETNQSVVKKYLRDIPQNNQNQ